MKINIFQIAYSKETSNTAPYGFSILNNIENTRPDWREYWPIRNYLLTNELSDDTLYGFFSPKFESKTNLNFNKIQLFINDNYENQDLVSFSPFWDLISIFKNVFEQGDFFHPGLASICQKFSDEKLNGIDLINAITNSGNSIFCNYFLAKKNFWLEWLNLGELLFSIAEKNNSELGTLLNAETSYGLIKLPMKIFVQERLSSICMLNNNSLKCLAYSPFNIGPSTTIFNKFLNESIISDSLKISYQITKNNIYLNQFSKIRDDILIDINS